ncbi:MAG: type I polyketide synthase, partial [Microbacteriaceae bacterium]
PQPVLTAAAMRGWPDGVTPPRAVASMRRNGADHRHIAEAVAGTYVAGHLPDFTALTQGTGRKLDLPTYPFEHRQYWFRDKNTPGRAAIQTNAARTDSVRLLEDGLIDELAALLDGVGTSNTTAEVLSKLAVQHNRQRDAQSISDARYEIRWHVSAPASPARAGEGSAWLLIGDGADTSQPLLDALTAHGHRYRTLAFPASDADEERLAGELRAAVEDEPALRILHLGALEKDRSPSMRTLLRMQHRVLDGTQRLFRAAAAADLRAPIWVLTHGAQRVGDTDLVAPEQTSLWGFCRAVALEYPQVWGGLADVAAGTDDEWSRLITWVSNAARGDDQIAVRGHAVHVPRLTRRTGQPNPSALELRSAATYLVTGGFGALGLEIAGYLAAHGARQLVLTSRRAPSEAAQQRIDEIHRQYGCQVRIITADVANPHDIAHLIATIEAELAPLAGIVHAAGENSTTPLNTLDAAELDRVFSGKVWGEWYLSEAITDSKLDFFLSTSSISAVWGSYGQSAYSAANAFLDGLTWRLREQGVPAFSVNFGPWAAGMADGEARTQLDRRGVRTLPPADALAGMADVLVGAGTHGVVARIDWARFLPVYFQTGERALLAEVAGEVPESISAAPAAAGTTQFVERLTSAPVQQRKKLVLEELRDAVAEVTQIDAAEIREETGLFDLGLDSLMAVELRRRLEQSVGAELPATLAMDHPRLTDMADYLLGDVLQLSDRAGKTTASTGPRPVSLTTAAADEPIAIIAVACRFPGAPDPDAYWDLLSGGVDAIREIPEDRFDVDEYYDPDQSAPGKIYTRSGGYLDSVDSFDPEFFGISPREAVWIDPQQRLMLELTWESLERAGYAPATLRGSRTGVFVGVGANEYSHLLSNDSLENLQPHFITGNALNAIAGRVSFTLGLEGPAMAVDTACSSSLVAVHQAAQALHSGDCDMALAGGVNVLLSPASVVAASRARMLSPDGRCKTFDAAADGYVRSEGCGILVLKRLSDAQRDGDRISAVIRSSAVNQDGASSGLTVPNGGAQQRLIASALARAGLSGADVDYLEAHGTGTPLGDPIEVQAAAAVYGADRDPSRPLLMGTAKTNIGHLESAAGVAGLVKVVPSLQNDLLPQTLHFQNPSPHIPWDSLPVQVVDKPTPWLANGRPRRAGVSAFGFTGTNAHVLLEEAPQPVSDLPDDAPQDTADTAPTREPLSVLPLSARSTQGLAALAQRYASWLDVHPDASIADVSFTAGAGRSHFEHRAAVVANSVPEAKMLLDDLVANRLRPGVVRGECTDPPTTAWFFPGQGSQYPGMARELFESEPVFADTVRQCAQAVDGMLPRPLLEAIFDNGREAAETLKHTSFAQPAIFAVEMGLARLWQSWGIEPDVVLGHSVGQYAAACVAGVFSLEDGARLIAERGRLFGSLPAGGRMVAVFADPEYVEGAAEAFDRVSVGAYNGRNTVLSGPGEDLEQI